MLVGAETVYHAQRRHIPTMLRIHQSISSCWWGSVSTTARELAVETDRMIDWLMSPMSMMQPWNESHHCSWQDTVLLKACVPQTTGTRVRREMETEEARLTVDTSGTECLDQCSQPQEVR